MYKILELSPAEDVKGEELKSERIRIFNRMLDLEIEEIMLKKRLSNLILSNTKGERVVSSIKELFHLKDKLDVEGLFKVAIRSNVEVGKALRNDLKKYDRKLQKLVQSMSHAPLQD